MSSSFEHGSGMPLHTIAQEIITAAQNPGDALAKGEFAFGWEDLELRVFHVPTAGWTEGALQETGPTDFIRRLVDCAEQNPDTPSPDSRLSHTPTMSRLADEIIRLLPEDGV